MLNHQVKSYCRKLSHLLKNYVWNVLEIILDGGRKKQKRHCFVLIINDTKASTFFSFSLIKHLYVGGYFCFQAQVLIWFFDLAITQRFFQEKAKYYRTVKNIKRFIGAHEKRVKPSHSSKFLITRTFNSNCLLRNDMQLRMNIERGGWKAANTLLNLIEISL